MPSAFGLAVHLSASGGEEFQGRCLAIEPVREQILASVEFEAPRAPLLPLGKETELEFRADGLETGVHAKALAIFRTDDESRRCYCFQGRVSKRVLMHLMDRRRALRKRLAPSEALKVSLLDLGEPAPEASLHDISATGFSLLLPPELEHVLFERSMLRAQFHVPGAASNPEVHARIRHRRLVGEKFLYGLDVEGGLPEYLRARGPSRLLARPPDSDRQRG